MVLVSGNVTIRSAALDRAASSAPFGSAANIRIAGLIDLAANATPDIKPPPTFLRQKDKTCGSRRYVVNKFTVERV